MKIGFFDSGLGGLLIAKSIQSTLPDYDFIYLGDTLHVPYGKRSKDSIYGYTKRCVEFLFQSNCQVVVTACNTVSGAALRRLQQEYLPSNYPDRRILGVVVPTLEIAIESGFQNIGVIATDYIIGSSFYKDELQLIRPDLQIWEQSAPLLVPMIEHNGVKWVVPILQEYLTPLLDKNIECLILGCTHYPVLKQQIQRICGDTVKIISQDEIIPQKLYEYLQNHPEIDQHLDRNRDQRFLVTDITENYKHTAQRIYGGSIQIEKIDL